jgi:hypothetical protein
MRHRERVSEVCHRPLSYEPTAWSGYWRQGGNTVQRGEPVGQRSPCSGRKRGFRIGAKIVEAVEASMRR